MPKNGFSLIELLVVIFIIAVLTAILMPNLMGARERARDAKKKEDLSSIKSALRTYYNDFQAYPTGAGGLDGKPLDSTFSSYFPSVSGLGYTYGYTRTNSGDGFNLSVGLESGSGDDDERSQAICGVDVGSTVSGIFMVCAN